MLCVSEAVIGCDRSVDGELVGGWVGNFRSCCGDVGRGIVEAIRSGSCSSTSLAVTVRNRSGSTFEAADNAIRSRRDGLPLNKGLEEKPMLCIKIYLNRNRQKQFLVGGLPTVAWESYQQLSGWMWRRSGWL